MICIYHLLSKYEFEVKLLLERFNFLILSQNRILEENFVELKYYKFRLDNVILITTKYFALRIQSCNVDFRKFIQYYIADLIINFYFWIKLCD